MENDMTIGVLLCRAAPAAAGIGETPERLAIASKALGRRQGLPPDAAGAIR